MSEQVPGKEGKDMEKTDRESIEKILRTQEGLKNNGKISKVLREIVKESFGEVEYLEELKESVYKDIDKNGTFKFNGSKQEPDDLDNEDTELDKEWDDFDNWDEEDWEEHWKKADKQRDKGYGNLNESTDCNDCGNSYLGKDRELQCFKGVIIANKKPKGCPYFDEFI